MGRRSFVSIAIAAVLFTTGCSSPLAPDSPDSTTVQVSGRVLAYNGPAEFNAIGGADLFGWIDAAGGGRPTGRIPLDRDGRFTLAVERGARVRLYAGGTTGSEIYQPCAVTIAASGNVTRDVKVVNDYDVIGAAVPPAFLEQTRILSGEVYETVPGAGRKPVPFATVAVGGFKDWEYDLGWPIANTRTDTNGRYVICGLEADASATIYVATQGREMVVSDISLNGDTVLDVELSHMNAARQTARR